MDKGYIVACIEGRLRACNQLIEDTKNQDAELSIYDRVYIEHLTGKIEAYQTILEDMENYV